MTVSAARLLDSVGRVIQSFHNLRSSGRLLGNPPLAVVVSSSRVSRVPPHLSPRGLALCAPHRATHGGSVAQDEIGTRDTFVCGTSLSTVDRPRLASVEHSCFRPCWEVLHFFLREPCNPTDPRLLRCQSPCPFSRCAGRRTRNDVRVKKTFHVHQDACPSVMPVPSPLHGGVLM